VADPKAAPPAPKRVAIVDPEGRFATVDSADVEAVERAGGRVLSGKEVAERAVQERYDAKSTAEKVVGGVKTALLATPLAPVVAGGIGDEAIPEVAAFGAGTRQGLTAGLADGATRQAIDAVGTHKQGDAFAEKVRQEREASPIAHGAGSLYGMGIGTAAGALNPAGAISAVGNVAEQVTARGLAGIASRGVMGRALATAGELGVRGAVEGALMGAGDVTGDAMLGDHELAADKVFAAAGMGALMGGVGGATIGFGGSLAKSAFVAAAPSARAGLSRVLGEAGAEAGSGLKGAAQDQAWRSVGAGHGLQTTQYAKRAEAYLPNGTRDVGEVLLRKGVINADEGVLAAVKGATPAEMAPKIEAELEKVGSRIGEITQASTGGVKAEAVRDAFLKMAEPYSGAAASKPAANALLKFGDEVLESLGVQTAGQSVSVQALLNERRAIDRAVFGDIATMDPKLATELKRKVRGELETLITQSLDEASGKVPGALKAEYKALKHDYTALSIASEAATDSAARMDKGATLGLRDMLAGGGNMATAFAHKVVRERGNAAAAVLFSKAAENTTLQRMIAKTDEAILGASKGVLRLPQPAKGLPAKAMSSVDRAKLSAEQITKIQANPEKLIEDVARQTEGLNQHAPQLAGAVTKRMTDAAAFLASKLPPQAPPDPFDPRPRARMSPTQAMEFARYASYVEKPMRFFEEAQRGQITFEGVETAKALMPRAFAEMQMKVAEGLADMLARNMTVPLRQRERLGLLMDFPAVPSQRPEHAMFLQSNVIGSEKANQGGGPPKGSSKPTAVKSPSSALDRLEERGAGRR
jgi:hypothetical protein